IGIGLDAGEAIPVEGGYRGAALNLAARLCELAGSGEVLATLAVGHLAGKTDGLAYLERGKVEVKGVVEPVQVVQVILDAEGGNESVAVPPPELAASELPMPLGSFLGALPSSTMVARDDELRLIEAAIGMAAKGTGQVLMLAGSPGVGKTRLAQE